MESRINWMGTWQRPSPTDVWSLVEPSPEWDAARAAGADAPPEPDPTEQRIAELEATVAALLDLLAGA